MAIQSRYTPTPNILDSIEVETVVGITGDYVPLPYGTLYKDVTHGVPAKDLPNHILVADEVADKGKVRRRTWLMYALTKTCTISKSITRAMTRSTPFTRNYVIPRNGYSPLPSLTKDSMDPSARLVQEQLQPTLDPQSLGTQFVKVTRVFHTLPGQLLLPRNTVRRLG